MLLFAPLARYIPTASLAGLLMLAAFRMVDHRQLLFHLRATRFDAGIVLATALAAVFISVEFCILIGVFLSFVLYIPRAAQVQLTEWTLGDGGPLRERVSGDPRCGRLFVYNLEGELFFGVAPELEGYLSAIEKNLPEEARVVVLFLKRARNPDAAFLGLLGTFHERSAEARHPADPVRPAPGPVPGAGRHGIGRPDWSRSDHRTKGGTGQQHARGDRPRLRGAGGRPMPGLPAPPGRYSRPRPGLVHDLDRHAPGEGIPCPEGSAPRPRLA